MQESPRRDGSDGSDTPPEDRRPTPGGETMRLPVLGGGTRARTGTGKGGGRTDTGGTGGGGTAGTGTAGASGTGRTSGDGRRGKAAGTAGADGAAGRGADSGSTRGRLAKKGGSGTGDTTATGSGTGTSGTGSGSGGGGVGGGRGGGTNGSETMKLRVPPQLTTLAEGPAAPPETATTATDGTASTDATAGTGRRRGPQRKGLIPPGLFQGDLLLSWLPLAVAVVLWLVSLPFVGHRTMGDYGLLDRMPITFYLALAVLTCGFLLSLRRAGTAYWWPAAYCVGLLFALKAVPAVLYDAVRYPWASKHDAVINQLLLNGELNPYREQSGNMGAYEQWPGFFSLNAAMVRVFGVESAAAYVNWAPIVLGLLMMPVLVVIYRTFTDDWRLVWVGVWIFQAANWVGQDYLAPQGFTFLLHLTVLAVVLRHFVLPGSAGPLRDRTLLDPVAAPVPPPTTVRQRAVCIAILVPLIFAINASHQLTPVMLCVSLVALMLTRRYRNWGLLATAVVIMLFWDLTMGRPLFMETLGTLKDSIGRLMENSRAGYAGELTGPGPELAGRANIIMVLSVALLAGIALLARRKLIRSALPLLLVSAAPVPLFAVNDYGGEMLFRVYLFGLPGAAFFAAAALVPAAAGMAGAAAGTPGNRRRTGRADTRTRVTAIALPVVLVALVAGFMPSYYGKEKMYYTPPAETAMVTRAIDRAPKDALILATTGSFPQALHRYEKVEHWFFAEQELPENEKMLRDPAKYLADGIPSGVPAAIVILTRTQDVYSAGEGLLPPGGFDELREKLEASPLFEVIEDHPYGVVLEYRPAGAAGSRSGGTS
ncbi:hypothetical protein ACIBCM_29790 [Streptomyces sp. NPDC051018]|uniref:hypothetical protein n=1 Tax=Streptomyces sp. NPDC051018 TaxID=3365639 RepID=UPI0037953511